jgi:hypothetical protein
LDADQSFWDKEKKIELDKYETTLGANSYYPSFASSKNQEAEQGLPPAILEEKTLSGRVEVDDVSESDSSESSEDDFIEANFVSGIDENGTSNGGLTDAQKIELKQEPTGLLDC